MMKIKRILAAAIKHAITTCVIGTTNKISDMERTNGWVFFSMFRYNHSSRYISDYIEQQTEEKIERKKIWEFSSDDPSSFMSVDLGYSPIDPQLDPLTDPKFALQDVHEELLLLALLTQEKRVGNCQARCCLIAKYLWENKTSEIHRIEILSFNFDHFVVVINREGEINHPETWGDALIADSWLLKQGLIYTAAEFITQTLKARNFIKTEYLQQYKLGFPGRLEVFRSIDWKNISWECYAELLPHQHKYPTYSPLHTIEYYYEPNNLYTAEITNNTATHPLLADRLTHVSSFKACLTQLTAPKSSVTQEFPQLTSKYTL